MIYKYDLCINMIYKYEINKFEKKLYIMTAGDSHIKNCMKRRINRLNTMLSFMYVYHTSYCDKI